VKVVLNFLGVAASMPQSLPFLFEVNAVGIFLAEAMRVQARWLHGRKKMRELVQSFRVVNSWSRLYSFRWMPDVSLHRRDALIDR
jgi:hypothetical protein